MAVYCCGDLHGRYDLYEKICQKITQDDTVIFLGDACDRGPDGWRLIKEILNQENWIYLKGNHEDMFIKAILSCQTEDGYDFERITSATQLSLYNGGAPTISAFIKDTDEDKFKILQNLIQLPLSYCYTNKLGVKYWCTHAGYTPWQSGNPYENASPKELIWGRDHITDCDFDKINDLFIIHGHTPIEFVYDYMEDEDGYWMGDPYHSPFLYGNDMKIDIDAGAAWNNEVILFNLDTHTFEIIR